MTTHRVIQISNLLDNASSQARVCVRAASNAASIRNNTAAGHFLRKASRLERIAATCERRLAHA